MTTSCLEFNPLHISSVLSKQALGAIGTVFGAQSQIPFGDRLRPSHSVDSQLRPTQVSNNVDT